MKNVIKSIVKKLEENCITHERSIESHLYHADEALKSAIAYGAFCENISTQWEDLDAEIDSEFRQAYIEQRTNIFNAFKKVCNSLCDLEGQICRLESIKESVYDSKFFAEHGLNDDFITWVRSRWSHHNDYLEKLADERNELEKKMDIAFAKKVGAKIDCDMLRALVKYPFGEYYANSAVEVAGFLLENHCGEEFEISSEYICSNPSMSQIRYALNRYSGSIMEELGYLTEWHDWLCSVGNAVSTPNTIGEVHHLAMDNYSIDIYDINDKEYNAPLATAYIFHDVVVEVECKEATEWNDSIASQMKEYAKEIWQKYNK